MLKWLKSLFMSAPPPQRKGWPWSHRAWEGVEIEGVGIVVGWDAETPGRVLCFTPDRRFVNYDLPDYKEEG